MKAARGSTLQSTRGGSLLRYALGFGLGGGMGIPSLYLVVWQLVEWVRIERVEALWPGFMVWFEALRTMFWPPSVLLLAAASGETAMRYLLLAILANVTLYSVAGIGVGLAMGRRSVFVLVSFAWVVGLCAVNALWLQHAGSLVAAIVLVVCLLATLYWRSD